MWLDGFVSFAVVPWSGGGQQWWSWSVQDSESMAVSALVAWTLQWGAAR